MVVVVVVVVVVVPTTEFWVSLLPLSNTLKANHVSSFQLEKYFIFNRNSCFFKNMFALQRVPLNILVYSDVRNSCLCVLNINFNDWNLTTLIS